MQGYSKPVWGWMMYDVASQPYQTLLITFIFAPYFTTTVVGDPVLGQSLWGIMTAIVGLMLAFLAPVFGAYADSTGRRRPWIVAFSLLYVFGALGLWWAVPDMGNPVLILIVFGIGYLGMELSYVFVSATLPNLCLRYELGKLSAHAFALGYAGGMIALFIMLFFFVENADGKTLIGIDPLFGLDPKMREGTRFAGPLSALWYSVFMIPFFAFVPHDVTKNTHTPPAQSLWDLFQTIKTLPKNLSMFSFLGASMFYRDALIGMYIFGGIYAAGVLGWSTIQLGIFGIVGGVAAVVCCWVGGYLDQRFGPKPIIINTILILIAVSVLILGTSRDSFMGIALGADSILPDQIFLICGALIGGAGGMLQSSSRTMLVHLSNTERMTEAFGIFALAGRATAWIAPSLIAMMTYMTQNQRLGLVPILLLLLIGLCLMNWVEPDSE